MIQWKRIAAAAAAMLLLAGCGGTQNAAATAAPETEAASQETEGKTAETETAAEPGPGGAAGPGAGTSPAGTRGEEIQEYRRGNLRARAEGSTLIISAESNPSTGYAWLVEDMDEDALRLDSSEYLADPTEGPTTGSGGTESFTFTVLKAGETEFRMTYAREWNRGGDLDPTWVTVTADQDLMITDVTFTEGAEPLPDYIYPGTDPLMKAVAEFAAEEHGISEEGNAVIPAPVILKKEEASDGSVRVYGVFWAFEYQRNGRTLETVSGGEYPGVLYLVRTGGGYSVQKFDGIGDGSQHQKDLQRIAGGDAALEQAFYDAEDAGKDPTLSVREMFLRDYIDEYNLNVDSYHDFGWDPVHL